MTRIQIMTGGVYRCTHR